MNWPVRRYQKPLLVAVALVGALLLTLLGDGHTGLSIRSTPAEGAVENREDTPDASGFRLRILSRVIMLVHERYIEPERIDQRAMLLGGLDYIQRTVAEVLLRHDEGSDEMTIIVNTAEQTFSLNDLDRPWALTFRFREIFRFLRANLQDENIDMEDIEYAACNGLLHTLDPHSVLLIPELYEEMRMGTRGEFGGLGIVISIRDGQLTIISPIDGTPAARAGLQRMDRIVMVGEETTINMTLEEAVDRLRGPPDTDVSIRVLRRGWNEPRLFEITRAIIRIESVESAMLPGGVGYIRIRNFQGNTHDDLVEQLGQLHQQGMRSLVLDLRDDPGGLLDQAVRIADTFLAEGVIVTTASNDPSGREVRRATPANTEPDYPMAVLVNSGSASASEIVAGALKYNNRAIIVGERTFGKGSVQVIYDFDDGSALKLTIAHYLTPGDISIQSVGIVPDIEVLSLLVRQSRVNLIPDESSIRESSLEAHLTGQGESPLERPAQQIRHYRIPEPRANREPEPEPSDDESDGTEEEQQDEAAPDDAPTPPDEANTTPDAGAGAENEARPEEPEDDGTEEVDPETLLEDFEVRLVHDLLRRARQTGRQALIAESGGLISNRQSQENTKMIAGLRRLDVNWSEGRDQGPSKVAVEFIAREMGDDGRLNEVQAGKRVSLTVRATNDGDAVLHRLHARSKSDNPYFDDHEFPLGRLGPGETQEWTVKLRVPRDAHTRADPVKIELTELHGHNPEPREETIRVHGLQRPTFSYAFHLVDADGGNGDGRLSRGERVRLFVTVTNQGPGRTFNAQVNIKNESGEGVLIHDGRFELGELQRGESRSHAFELEVLPSFENAEVELELTVTDFELREEVTESLDFLLVNASQPPQPANGAVRTRDRTTVFEWAEASAHTVGWLPAGASYAVGAEQSTFLRLRLGDGRVGWVARDDVEPLEGQTELPEPRFEVRMDNTPPEIDLSAEPPARISADHLDLEGVVNDADRVLDMYVFVGRRKVFYLSNREGADPRRMAFNARLPLEPGSNTILIVARESGDVFARRIMIIRRDGQSEEARGQE